MAEIHYVQEKSSIFVFLIITSVKTSFQNSFTDRFAFSAVTLLLGWQEGHLACKTQSWDVGVVVCLGQGADLHMAQLMPLPLSISCFSKFRLVLPSWLCVIPFWCRLTRVVPDKIQKGHKMVVCVIVKQLMYV